MDAVREQLQKPLIIGVVGLVVGLLIGWLLIGWVIWPVQWTDADPQHLRADLKIDYLRMAVDSYAQNQDAGLAKDRYDALGKEAADVLQQIEKEPGKQSAMAISAYTSAVQGTAAGLTVGTPAAQGTPSLFGTPPAEGTSMAQETPAVSNKPKKSTFSITGLLKTLIPIVCGIVLLLLIAAAVVFFLRRRQPGNAPVMSAKQASIQPGEGEEQWQGIPAAGEEHPMVQFTASYKLGDDLFDDSFSIDSPGGEFLGECGVSISEAIGVGDPKKVSAFEVWLFDKNDIQTVTKVMMSANAFGDEAVRQRLTAKGEPVLAELGKETVLETQTLHLTVRVLDMNYGEGPLPPKSFFDRLTLDLAVWAKQ